jgi:hypothetical protein
MRVSNHVARGPSFETALTRLLRMRSSAHRTAIAPMNSANASVDVIVRA